MTDPNARATAGPCPTFFQALCFTARSGGEASYANAGFALTGALNGESPDNLTTEEWDARLDALDVLLRKRRTDAQIEAWFELNLPRCIQLVPKRRRSMFVSGVRRRFEQDGGLTH